MKISVWAICFLSTVWRMTPGSKLEKGKECLTARWTAWSLNLKLQVNGLKNRRSAFCLNVKRSNLLNGNNKYTHICKYTKNKFTVLCMAQWMNHLHSEPRLQWTYWIIYHEEKKKLNWLWTAENNHKQWTKMYLSHQQYLFYVCMYEIRDRQDPVKGMYVCMYVCISGQIAQVCISGQIAQVVEHQTADQWIAGSSLTSGEKCKNC